MIRVVETRSILEAGHAQTHLMESRGSAEAMVLAVAEKFDGMRLGEAARVVREGFAETLTYATFPREHWRCIRTNSAIERLNREIRRRTRVVDTFPDGRSALTLVTAGLNTSRRAGGDPAATRM